MNGKKWMAVVFAAAALGLQAGDFPLVKNGKAANIVIGEYFPNSYVRKTGISEGECFAAIELADYAEKVTGIRPSVSMTAAKDRPNIYLLQWHGSNPPAAKANISSCVGKIRYDGFYLYADENRAYVIGKRPRAVMYGVYEILRKYGEVRWLFPGKEGESVIRKNSIIIPEQSKVFNPSIPERNFNLVCAYIRSTRETPIWMMRNNMQAGFIDRDTSGGGHIFSTLLPDTYFPAHPEYYGLYNGKRLPQCGKILSDPSKYRAGGQKNQPCTSNPEVRKIMLQNLLKYVGQRRIDKFSITNNDSTKWCECEKCRKIDPPEEVKRGLVSTRFWDLANYLIPEAKKVYPNLRFSTSAYQNYQEPPAHLKPCPGVQLDLCVHHRCYLHDINDPKCDLNVRYRNLIQRWNKLGVRVSTYEYSNMMPRSTVYYLPLEGVLSRDIKYYASQHNVGYCDEAAPYDGYFGRFSRDRTAAESWKSSVLVRYVQAAFMWNADADLDTVIEEFGSRYYGKAWPVMKKYRTALRKAYESTDSHFLYGTQPMALGKTVADPKVFAGLNDLLAQGIKAAGNDKVILQRVKDEKEYFDLSFGVLRKQYLDQQQAPCVANHTTGKIVIDGDFSEEDWKKAVPVSDFRIFNSRGKKATKDTEVRVLWDEKNLYFAVSVKEPDMAKVKRNKTPVPVDDPKVWMSNNLEFFFNTPSFGYKYLHWVTNPQGGVWDALTLTPQDSKLQYNANAEVKTRILKDSWQAEIRMPFAALGNYVPKKGARLRTNIASNSQVNGEWEGTSWSYGAFHGTDSYREILLK